jgi:hypothetical protein
MSDPLGPVLTIKAGQTQSFGMHWGGGNWTGITVIAAKPLNPGSPLSVSNLSVELQTNPTSFEWFFQVKNEGPLPVQYQLEAAAF